MAAISTPQLPVMTFSTATSTTTLFDLFGFPDEILLIIISHLDFDTLLDAVCVSRHFKELAEPFLYRNIPIPDGERALALSHSLSKDKRRPTWVRSLLVSTRFGHERELMRLPSCLSRMDNLQDLRLETPDCNSKKPQDRVLWIELQDRYEEVFKQSSMLMADRESRSLPNLRSCVLHFVDTHTELYSLSRYSSIFLHPTLQSLTISCMSTDYPHHLFPNVDDIGSLKHSTALEHLHLEECDLHPASLELVLSFPKALKSLKISEGTRYDGIFRAGSSRMHGNVRPEPLAQALVNTCKDSLESLSLALGYTRSHGNEIFHTGQYLKLSELENLKYLEVNNRTLNLIRSRPVCDHKTWKRLPQSLNTLKVFAVPLIPPQHDLRQPSIPLLPCIVRQKKLHGLPNLKKIVYSYEHYDSTDDDDMNFNDLLMNLVYNEANGNPTAENENADLPVNQHHNPILNLLQHAVGVVNPPPPPPVPAAANFVTAAMTPNLDMPPQHIQPPRFRWRTAPQPSRPELSRSDTARLGLLNTVHESLLPHFVQSNTEFQIDLVTLPRGFIPPYLFPEDKPKVHEAWFTSTSPMTPADFIEGIHRQREAARQRVADDLCFNSMGRVGGMTTAEFIDHSMNGIVSDDEYLPSSGEDDEEDGEVEEADDDEEDEEEEEEEEYDDTDSDGSSDEMEMDDMLHVFSTQAQNTAMSGYNAETEEVNDTNLDTDVEEEEVASGANSIYVDALSFDTSDREKDGDGNDADVTMDADTELNEEELQQFFVARST